jgi:hypothetical protein
MGVHQAKNNLRLIEEFNQKNGSTIANLAKLLKHRSLANHHFDLAAGYIDEWDKTPLIPIQRKFEYNKTAALSRRVIAHEITYMSVFDEDQRVRFDCYIPVVSSFCMSKDMVFYCNRPYPLTLSSQHVEFRFNQRAAQTLDYEGEAFMNSMTTALALSLIMEKRLSDSGSLYEPVVVPHERGFFLGYAELVDQTMFHPIEPLYATHTKHDPKKDAFLRDHLANFSGSPSVRIGINTFISIRELDDAQAELRDAFKQLAALDTYVNSISALQEDYKALGLLCREESPIFNAVKKELADEFISLVRLIVESDTWNRATEKSEKHLPQYEIAIP